MKELLQETIDRIPLGEQDFVELMPKIVSLVAYVLK